VKRFAVLVCLTVMAVSCGGESADAPAVAVEPTTAESNTAESNTVESNTVEPNTVESIAPASVPAAPTGLVSRDDVVITAPTVLWFWAPG